MATMTAARLTLLIFAILSFAGRGSAERTVLVRCESTAGAWEAEVHPSWSPNGAKRYLELVEDGFFTNVPLFRAVPGFLVQFGISLDASMNRKYAETIADDPFPVQVEMKAGIMAFAGYGKHSRSTQVWIGYEGASGLGHSPWETPFAEIVKGMDKVVAIYGGYGGDVDQGKIHAEGEKYLSAKFPKLDYIKHCSIKKTEETA